MARLAYDEDEIIPSFSETVAEFSDIGSADMVAGLLEGENVHALVVARGLLAGVASSYHVLVDPRQLHRAKWILRDADLSEAELTFLATGELGSDSE